MDRIFRHLLVDVTGNTHRAEFCIDKLYSPDSATGRLGLLELRGFEMPPHARMSLTQQLLVRALIAWFWKEPYTHKPIRWGTRLHDQFMLPHFVEQRFSRSARRSEARRLSRSRPNGSRRTSSSAIRCSGTRHHAGIDIELRQATEPWYVLGEEAAAGGTARYVDSSVERVQVKVERADREPLRGHLQRPARAAALHRHAGRMGGGRALPGVAAAVVPASDDSGAYAAGVRRGGYCGRAAPWAAAPITWRIPAGAASTRSR